MNQICKFIFSISLLLISACALIQLKPAKDTKILSSTVMELLSLFKQCIVFTFDWAIENNYDSVTSTSYFNLYSESMGCSLVVETLAQYRNKSVWNPRFLGTTLEPHPLFTKHTAILVNLYSSGATSTDVGQGPATDIIYIVLRKYNIPFNYVLLFMTTERFSAVNNGAMLSAFPEVSIPAVYILVLDEKYAYVVGFAHVLQSLPYLFRVPKLQVAEIHDTHRRIHQNLQQALVFVNTLDFSSTSTSSSQCDFGSSRLVDPNGCAFRELTKKYNATTCDYLRSSCPCQRISFMCLHQEPSDAKSFTRAKDIYMEFIDYPMVNHEYSFIFIVETGSIGFMAFVQAFHQRTWIITGIVFTCLTVIVAAISTKEAVCWGARLLASAIAVIMLLFERFYVSSQLQRAASRQTILIINLWAFGAMLLGMSYSENMVSELAAPSLPPVPRDMHELSVVDYPIFTSSRVLLWRNDVLVEEGYLHSEISEYLEMNPSKTGTLTNDLRRLSTAMTLLKDGLPTYQANYQRISKVLFAYVSEPVTAQAAGLVSELASKRLRTLRGGNLPFFNSREYITVQSNSLLRIFHKFLASICEPGIWKYWEKGATAEDLKRLILNGLHNRNTTILGKSLGSRINLAAIWRSFVPLMEGTTSWSPVDVDNLSPAFQLLGVCLLISTLVICYERWPPQQVLSQLLRTLANVKRWSMTERFLILLWRASKWTKDCICK